MDFSFIFGRDSGRWSQAINPFDRLRTGIARAMYITTQAAPFAKTVTLIERVVPVPVLTVEAGWE